MERTNKSVVKSSKDLQPKYLNRGNNNKLEEASRISFLQAKIFAISPK